MDRWPLRRILWTLFAKVSVLIFSLSFLSACNILNGGDGVTGGGIQNETPGVTPPAEVDNRPRISISSIGGSPAEENLVAGAFQISRTGPTEEPLVVNVLVSGTATPAIDYETINTSFTIPAAESSISIAITPLEDTEYEGQETIIISVDSNSEYVADSNSPTIISIIENDLPMIGVQASLATIPESGSASMQFTFSRTGYNGETLNLSFSRFGSALNGIDFETIVDSVTFAVGESTATKTITSIDDSILDPNEIVYIFLAPSTNFELDPMRSYAFVTIVDDESGIGLSASNSTSKEAGSGSFTFNRYGPDSSQALTINFTISGTATSGIDYTAISSSVVLPANQASVAIPVNIIGDTILEENETVILTITPTTDFLIAGSLTGTVTIIDNDSNPNNRAVKLSANVQSTPPQVTLSWAGDPTTIAYKIYRKALSDTTWGAEIASLAAGSTSYVDSTVSDGAVYEYKVDRSGTGYGYIYVGIRSPPVEDRGKVILLVDSTISMALESELGRFEDDLTGDGWKVIRHDVARSESVVNIKSLILSDYNSDPANVKSVFIFGHVPVPYSGQMAPDGHGDHSGAWPTDGYYGDIDGIWTDTTVNTTSASSVRNRNIPGDGKFDQSSFPSNVDLQVGRVDFYDMPTFAPLTEVDLLRRYLNKNHDFRHRTFTADNRALIDDNFGEFNGEAFASSSWRSFSSLLGGNQVFSLDWFTTLNTNAYLFAHANGGGSYTSCGGVGTTTNFATTAVKAVFTSIFGSYFGDWDSTNNLMRAAIASEGYTLTTGWSGRPMWNLHQMSMGESIGLSAKLAQNNDGTLYYSGSRGVHIGLMGDPTLRMSYVAPIENLVVTQGASTADLTWTASVDAVLGYHVYRKSPGETEFTRLTSVVVNGTTFSDNTAVGVGLHTYMVRAIKLEVNNSGSYYNISQGILSEITIN